MIDTLGARFRAGDLLIAAAFLTRLPVHRLGEPPPDRTLAEASWAFPLVGAAIGLAGAIAWRIAEGLGTPPLASALIAIAATALLTGALHEDGLADTADGFGGGATREAKLAIMRDSRSGAFGVLALVLSVGLRAAALAALAGGGAVAALIAAHALARGVLPAMMYRLAPARADGLGAGAGRPDAPTAAWALGIGALVALGALGFRHGLGAVLLVGIGVVATGVLAWRQIGGQTGDVLGAAEQIGEILVLLAAAS